jgi:hypothetical protein
MKFLDLTGVYVPSTIQQLPDWRVGSTPVRTVSSNTDAAVLFLRGLALVERATLAHLQIAL